MKVIKVKTGRFIVAVHMLPSVRVTRSPGKNIFENGLEGKEAFVIRKFIV